MKIIIASESPPVTRENEVYELNLGGYSTGLRPLLCEQGGLWISPVKAVERVKSQSFDYPPDEPRFTVESLPISPELFDGYSSLSNQVLWPVMHHQPQYTDIQQEYFEAYRHVNWSIADRIEQRYEKGDLVWIQDHQQLLVPQIVRQKIPNATIGLFFHIPWPSHRFFTIVPWREDLLRGMLGADLIGFNVREYATNFLETVRKLPSVRVDENYVWWKGRKIRVEVHPIGIDVEYYKKLGTSNYIAEKAKKIRKSADTTHIVIGVDRLDYTKGILERFLAYERFLERNPEYHGNISFYQLAIPYRTELPSYKAIKEEIDKVAGRINAAFMTDNWVPLRYFFDTFLPQDRAAFYRAADVALVTPLYDGMNAVAQEYVAVNDTGSLLLSQFAGVSAHLRSAYKVNPHFVDGLTDEFERVLSKSPEEKQIRWNKLKKELNDLDSQWWARGFYASIRGTVPLTPKPIFFLDYDGTLAPIVNDRDMAVPHPDAPEVVRGLLEKGYPVYLVSGRKVADLDRLLGIDGIPAFGVHGMEEGVLGGEVVSATVSDSAIECFERLRRTAPSGDGFSLEDKKLTLAMHYREYQNEEEAILLLTKWVASIPKDIELIWGKRVLEIRPSGFSKGEAVEKVMKQNPDRIPIYIGDDTTDEDAFLTLGPRSITVKVGLDETAARFRVKSISEALRYLRKYVE